MKKTVLPKYIAYLVYIRKHILITAAILIGLISVVAFLSRIPGLASLNEHASAFEASSISRIIDNPINAPFKIAVFLTTLISPSILAIRSISLLIFFATSIALYATLRHWHTKQAAALATVAFSSNAVVLAVGRLGTPLVTVFGWFIFTAMLLWQVHGHSNRVVPSMVLFGASILLYTPGALWFFIVFSFFYSDRFRHAFRNVKGVGMLVGSFLALLVVTPLAISFAVNPHILGEWLLLPEAFSPATIGASLLEVPSAFIYKMPRLPLLTVSTLPILDLSSGFLFLMGVHAYRKKLQLDRTRLMIAMALIGVIIGAFGDVVTGAVVLMPFAFSIIAAGIEFLLDEWNGVFPKNPFAKSFGFIAVTTVVLFGAYYQLTRFMVVWPQTPETRSTYDTTRIIQK